MIGVVLEFGDLLQKILLDNILRRWRFAEVVQVGQPLARLIVRFIIAQHNVCTMRFIQKVLKEDAQAENIVPSATTTRIMGRLQSFTSDARTSARVRMLEMARAV